MKALAAFGRVPFSRVMQEHRAWVLPLVIVLLVNVGLLVGAVLPLARSAASSEQRAEAARQALAAAEDDFKAAEAMRDGQSAATRDLDTFYSEVLPKDSRVAARMTHLRLAQLAEKHGVRYERMSASPTRERDSSLEVLSVQMGLSGEYDAIRAFLHELETSPDFVIIDNMILSEDGEADSEGLALTLDLSTYYLARPNGG